MREAILCLFIFLILKTAFASLYAVKSNGVIQSWGLNNYGQLGIGTSKPSVSEPTIVYYPTFVNTSFTIESICPTYGVSKAYSKIFVTTAGELYA
jgi:alpha-tubulin suppressor-like RCC1 family protein